MNAGHRSVAVGTSESHHTADFSGNPCTWLFAPDGDMDRALNKGLAVAGGGPFLSLAIEAGGIHAEIGQTLVATGRVAATIRLKAPPWMPLGELVLFANGI